MGTITRSPTSFTAGTPAVAADVNNTFNTIYNEFNGNIDAANLASGAVTNAKLATNAVDSTKIQTGAVGTDEIAASAVTDAKVATGIDAAKLANGTVSNTEFQYLNGVTSAIQTQIDGIHTAYWGRVTSGGSWADGTENWTVDHPASGQYTVTHNKGTSDYGVSVNVETGGGGAYAKLVYPLGINSFTVHLFTSSGAVINDNFFFTMTVD